MSARILTEILPSFSKFIPLGNAVNAGAKECRLRERKPAARKKAGAYGWAVNNLRQVCGAQKSSRTRRLLGHLDLNGLSNHSYRKFIYTQFWIIDPGAVAKRESPMMPRTGDRAAGNVALG
jgi:hypothetical protein